MVFQFFLFFLFRLTTWNPTPKNATSIPNGPIDYASKHWSGLIKDYYSERVRLLTNAFVQSKNKKNGRPNVDLIKAKLAYNFTTSNKLYPTTITGDPITTSQAMHTKYRSWFSTC